jgi:hypothetical protein
LGDADIALKDTIIGAVMKVKVGRQPALGVVIQFIWQYWAFARSFGVFFNHFLTPCHASGGIHTRAAAQCSAQRSWQQLTKERFGDPLPAIAPVSER